ncbi:MAG: SUF system Fe-S cluster assembly regulator [Pseudoxanthomonas suwonensis]|nr:SUF system Fe-S cluster assembly regulator [Pseudoxanthomonas suwonensis]
MLRVTKLTDYATIALAELAMAGDVRLSAAELAERAGLEAPTVAKVLKPLAHAGILEGQRGAGGGYRLARAARDVLLIDIVEALEGPLAMTECIDDHGNCDIQHACGLRANWRRINDIVADALRAVTLAQLAGLDAAPRKPIALQLATA